MARATTVRATDVLIDQAVAILHRRYIELKTHCLDSTRPPMTEAELQQFATLVKIEHLFTSKQFSLERLSTEITPGDAPTQDEISTIDCTQSIIYLETRPNSALQLLCMLSKTLRNAEYRQTEYDHALEENTLAALVEPMCEKIDAIVKRYLSTDRLILLHDDLEYILLARSTTTGCDYRLVDKSLEAPHAICKAATIAVICAYVLKYYY